MADGSVMAGDRQRRGAGGRTAETPVGGRVDRGASTSNLSYGAVSASQRITDELLSWPGAS
ncbi:MAG: hypothetical protein ACXVY5_07870, partial [Gaiellales bacterium]